MKNANKAVILAMSAVMLVGCNQNKKSTHKGGGFEGNPENAPVERVDQGPSEEIAAVTIFPEIRSFTPGCANAVYSLSTSNIIMSEKSNLSEQLPPLQAEMSILAKQNGEVITNITDLKAEYKNGESVKLNLKRAGITTEKIEYFIKLNGVEIYQELEAEIDFSNLEFHKFDLESATEVQKQQTTFVMPALEGTRFATIDLKGESAQVSVQVVEECGEYTLPIAEKLTKEMEMHQARIEQENIDREYGAAVAKRQQERAEEFEKEINEKEQRAAKEKVLANENRIAEIKAYDPHPGKVFYWKHADQEAYEAHLKKIDLKNKIIENELRIEKEELEKESQRRAAQLAKARRMNAKAQAEKRAEVERLINKINASEEKR